ncbi:unnamed protein product [Musa textilis]
MGKTPVRMKAVVYALSPFQQKVMAGLWKDLPGKIHHKVSENWLSATLLLAPVIGTYRCVSLLVLCFYESSLYCLNAYVDLLYVDAVMPSTIRRRRSWNTGTKDDMAFGEFNTVRKVF